jgi:hypothetical protein
MQDASNALEIGYQSIRVCQDWDHDKTQLVEIWLHSRMSLELGDLLGSAYGGSNFVAGFQGENHSLEANVARDTGDLQRKVT